MFSRVMNMPFHSTIKYTYNRNYLYKTTIVDKYNNTTVTRNGKMVWKHGPNWPFYTLMLRTKLYQNPFFFTGHLNVNKPKSRASLFMDPHFYLFMRLLSAVFSYFLSKFKQKKIKNCAIMGCNLSKKHILTLYETQNGEPNYVL